MKRCAVCNSETYDEEPVALELEGKPLRLWVCSTECAYVAGLRVAHVEPTLRAFRALFNADGLELL